MRLSLGIQQTETKHALIAKDEISCHRGTLVRDPLLTVRAAIAFEILLYLLCRKRFPTTADEDHALIFRENGNTLSSNRNHAHHEHIANINVYADAVGRYRFSDIILQRVYRIIFHVFQTDRIRYRFGVQFKDVIGKLFLPERQAFAYRKLLVMPCGGNTARQTDEPCALSQNRVIQEKGIAVCKIELGNLHALSLSRIEIEVVRFTIAENRDLRRGA